MNGPAMSFARERQAQSRWARVALRDRLACVRRLRHDLAQRSAQLASLIRREPAQTLTAEILPLLEACRFLEENAETLLAPQKPQGKRPSWLGGVELEIRHDPLGLVLVIGPRNYPLFLPGVHGLQALVAGNAVVLKPGSGAMVALCAFVDAAKRAGFDADLIRLLGEDPEDAQRAIEAGVDKVVLTGSSETGKAVLEQLAKTGIPAVMELSGHDVVFVRPGADAERVRKAVGFGLSLNDGDTCIAPKIVVAWPGTADAVSGLPLPVQHVADDTGALEVAARSGYALGATVFGEENDAIGFAHKVNAGVVVVNDMIVPTADPRLPFGGRGKSGFGVTRGAEGLLEMTAVKAIAVRRGRWLPHLEPAHSSDAGLFSSYIGFRHGGSWRTRFSSARGLIRALLDRRQRSGVQAKETQTI